MQCLTIEQNKNDGNWHAIHLVNVEDFYVENKVILNHFKEPQDVIWAQISGMANFPIANFKSRAQRDKIFKVIDTLDIIEYSMLYEQVFTDAHAFEFLRDYKKIKSYHNYFRKELRRLQEKHLLTEIPVFKNMTYPDIERLLNGSIVPYADLPSVRDLARTLKVPLHIIQCGITPRQFFTHIINETYDIPFSV